MITINLLPEELRVTRKINYKDPQYILLLVIIIFSLLLANHIFLFVSDIVKTVSLNSLNSKWQKLQPNMKEVEEFRAKHDLLASSDTVLMQQLLAVKLNWPQKLNRLSLDLPSGVWFNDVSFSAKTLFISCSAVSLQKEEMGMINKFIDNLKNDKSFFNDFVSLELGSVQRRMIAAYEVVDFSLSAALK
ncbi:MAG: hypothetical protein JW788_04030 [Candidatus Omnitrophica bacterium]|nr:hypothetical protein [Candidatus Omnitrophota bacterium]